MRLVLGALLVVAGAGVVAISAQDSAPVWAKSDAFWYRTTVNGSDVWVTVDAGHGVRQPLFDHQRLAIELSQKTGIAFTASTLPFAKPGTRFVVKYDGSSVPVAHGLLAIEFSSTTRRGGASSRRMGWAARRRRTTNAPRQDGPVPPGLLRPVPTGVGFPRSQWEAFVRERTT